MDTKSISGTMGPSASGWWMCEYRVLVRSGKRICTFRVLCGCNYLAAEYLIRDVQFRIVLSDLRQMGDALRRFSSSYSQLR